MKERVLVISEVVLAALVFVFNLFQLSGAISFCFAAGFLVLIGYLAFSGVIRNVNRLLFYLLLAAIVSVLVNGLANPVVTFSFDYFKKLIFFCTSVIYFEIASRISLTTSAAKVIKWIILSMVIILLIDYYLLQNRTMYGFYLTLGFTNPNFTSMWLMHLCLFMVYYFSLSSRIICKLGYAVAFLLTVNIIFPTLNRSTLVVLVLFFILVVIGVFNRKKTFPSIVLFIIVLVPFIFFLLYQSFLSNKALVELFNFAVSESQGKSLDTRLIIWDYATQLLNNMGWLFGDYASLHFSNSTGMLQMHNSHLDILVSYGIVTFALFIAFQYVLLRRINDHDLDWPRYIAFCGFISVILLGMFEAGIYAGCTGLNFLSGLFLILANTGAPLTMSRLNRSEFGRL